MKRRVILFVAGVVWLLTHGLRAGETATPATLTKAAGATVAGVWTTAANGTSAADKTSASAAANLPRVFSLDPARLAEAKARIAAHDPELKEAMNRLRRTADKALQAKPLSVMDKPKTPPSGDKHDFMTLAPYSWPDPDKSDGLPWINRDGEVNPASREGSDRVALEATTSRVEALSLAWYFTGEEAYAEKAASLLSVWFLDPATRMNPNLNFAQGIPGRSSGRGIGIIDTQTLILVANATGLLEGSRAWTPAIRDGMKQWFEDYKQWMMTSKNGRDEAKAANNHGTWYRAQLAAYALAAEDPATARRMAEEGKALIASQIEPDGSMPLELKRTKSYMYTVFNIRAFFLLAEIGRRVDVDIYSYRTQDGRSLRAALEYMRPYFNTTKRWPKKQIAKTKQPDEALAALLRQAALVFQCPEYESLIEGVDPATRAPWQFQLLWPRKANP